MYSTINIELTSRCNKDCWCCGRRKREKEIPGYKDSLGDMDFELFCAIADQIPKGVVCQLHWDGEPTLYPHLKHAIARLKLRGCYVCFNTNGLMMWAQRPAIDLLDSVTVSIIPKDSDMIYAEQASQIEKYLATKPPNGPVFNMRFLGDKQTLWPINVWELARRPDVNIITRILHSPDMSRNYTKQVTKPEHGVCMDLLAHPAINRHGEVFTCPRFNADKLNFLGDIRTRPLADILSGEIRRKYIRLHFLSRRNEVPLCRRCDFYGCPTSWDW